MHLAFPQRIPFAKTVACAAALAAVQLLQHTSAAFAVLFFSFVVLSVVTFNYAGGFSRPSGAFVFFFSVLAVIFGVVMKAVLNEPANSNLRAPTVTMAAYNGTMIAMLLAVAVSRKLTSSAPGIPSIVGANRVNLRHASLGCVIVGLVIQVISLTLSGGSGTVISAINQVNFFMPLGIILGTVETIRSTGGKRSINLLIFLAILYSTLTGVLAFSKQGMFTGFAAWFLAACFMRLRIRLVHGIVLVGFAVLSQLVLAPLSVGRIYEAATIKERIQVVELLLSDISEVRREADEEAVTAGSYSGFGTYYNHPEGLIDRLSMIVEDDLLIDFTEHGHVLGYGSLKSAFQNWIPHFLLPHKDVEAATGGGNFYFREMGLLPSEDNVTGISISATSEAFHFGGWQGIFLAITLIMTMMFVVTDWLMGDMSRHPWGILIVLLFAHIAPEDGLLGPIYMTVTGNIALIIVIVFCTYVIPILGSAFSRNRTAAPENLNLGSPGGPPSTAIAASAAISPSWRRIG